MNVVFVASEAVPFAKTGGLADVAGALPARPREARPFPVCVPSLLSPRLVRGRRRSSTRVSPFEFPLGARSVEGNVYESRLPGSDVRVYLIDQPRYFDRDGLYGSDGKDYEDNCERFVFFDRAVLETIQALRSRPDVIHCNDWQTGLIPVYLKTIYQRVPELGSAGTLLTIHNLAYLGLFPHWEMALTGLDWHLFNWRQLEFHGKLCFMKAGLVFADMLSTVSPTYAREIQTPRAGIGSGGPASLPTGRLARNRQRDRRRGLEPEQRAACWPPSMTQPPSPTARPSVRPGCSGRQAWPSVPTSRCSRRSAVSILKKAGTCWPRSPTCSRNEDVQLVVLGEGHPKYHALLEDLARRHAGKFWAYLGFADDLAHQIEAGADVFLMPSLFEPCGLNQLYSLAHGTVPVVRATGGLADTVIDASPRDPCERNGHGFRVYRTDAAGSLGDDRTRSGPLARPRDWLKLHEDRNDYRLVVGAKCSRICRALRGNPRQSRVTYRAHLRQTLIHEGRKCRRFASFWRFIITSQWEISTAYSRRLFATSYRPFFDVLENYP